MADQNLRATVGLNDQMTPALRSIVNSMRQVIASLDDVRRSTGQAFDSSTINAARTSINQAEVSLRSVERQARQNAEAQRQHTQSVQQTERAANGLMDKLKGVAATYLTFQALKQGTGLLVAESDQYANIGARLSLINDGLKSTKQLQKDVLELSSMTGVEYKDMAALITRVGMMAGGNFSGTEQVMEFAEQIGKLNRIGGGDAASTNAAVTQLVQGLASGTLRGEELNSVMEQAPMISQALAKHLGVSVGQLRAMAKEGEITSKTVIDGILAMSGSTDEMFDKLPKTWGMMWNKFKNDTRDAFAPVFEMMNRLADSTAFQAFINGAVGAIRILAGVMLAIGSAVEWVFTQLQKLGSALGITQAQVEGFFTAFGAIMAIVGGAVMIGRIVALIKWIRSLTIITKLFGNASLIAWIKAAWPILLVIGLVGGVIYALYKAGVTMADVAGVVFGCFNAMGAMAHNFEIWANQSIENVYVAYVNAAKGIQYEQQTAALNGLRAYLEFGQKAQLAVEDFAFSASQAFASWVNSGISYVNLLIGALNALGNMEIFGKKLGINIPTITFRAEATRTTSLSGTTQKMLDALGNVEKPEQLVAKDYVSEMGGYQDVGDAYRAGSLAGQQWGADFSSKVGGILDTIKGIFNGDSILDTSAADAFGQDIFNNPDMANDLLGGGDDVTGKALKDIAGNTKGTKDNTYRTADILKKSDDELKFIREVSRRKAVSNLGLGSVTVKVENNFNGSIDKDNYDGFITKMTKEIEIAIGRSANGVVKA